MVWSGLWHSWSMFAPSPVQFERRLEVLLTMKDGATETHELFKIHEASVWRAFLGVRDRKFQVLLSQNKNSKNPRAAICSYAAKKLASNPEQVAKSQLIVKKRKIRKMDETEDHEIEEKSVWTINYDNS
jgi:hypothetical protein